MNVLRHCEREIVRALAATGSTQSQVTHADRFEIATDDVVVKVWTVDAYERERGAVAENEKLRLQVAALENDGMELAARLGEAEEQIARLTTAGGQ